jgi:hypothetical protein
MKKFIAGLVSFAGLFLFMGSIGGMEAETMSLSLGVPMAIGGVVLTAVALELLQMLGVEVF